MIQDYRISPEDGVLEHVAAGIMAPLWVAVMPNVVLPADWPYEEGTTVTWRRYAFERAHATVLEPHRPSDASEAVLRRIAYWKGMSRDFTVWINGCRTCQQFRSVGQMQPM